MKDEPNDNSEDIALNDTAAEDLNDTLVGFESEQGANEFVAPSADVNPSLGLDGEVSEPKDDLPSFGDPISSFDDSSNVETVRERVVETVREVKPASSVHSSKPTPSRINDIKPASSESTPATSFGETGSSPLTTSRPEPSSSSAIGSLIAARDRAEDGKKHQKSIKLPSAKKSGVLKVLLWPIVGLLVVGLAVGWFFAVKTPADQAAAAYKSEAIGYLESVSGVLDESAGELDADRDLEATIAKIEETSRPELESTLLSVVSFSSEYTEAVNLRDEVNSQVDKVVNGIRGLLNGNDIAILDATLESDGAAILSRITDSNSDEQNKAIYQEYVEHLEDVRASMAELAVDVGEAKDLYDSYVAAVDAEINAYKRAVAGETSSDAQTDTGSQSGPGDNNVDESGADIVSDEDSEDATNEDAQPAPAQDSDSLTPEMATHYRRIASTDMYLFLWTNSSGVFDKLKDDLNSYIATLR